MILRFLIEILVDIYGDKIYSDKEDWIYQKDQEFKIEYVHCKVPLRYMSTWKLATGV